MKREEIREILKTLPPLIPKQRLKATVAACSETELSLETQQERLATAARRLFDEQKRQIEEQNRRIINERRQAALCPAPLTPPQQYQVVVDGWIEMQHQARMYERQLRREYNQRSCGLSIYGIEGEDD